MSANIESIEGLTKRKPGPVPGSRHSGMFQPGIDMRRNPPIKRNLMEQCAAAAQESAPKAIQFLTDVMEGEDQPVKVRLVAAKEILDRSIGQSVAMTVHREMTAGNSGDIQRLSNSAPEDLTDKQLLEVIRQQCQAPQVKAIEEEPVDAEFTESVVEEKTSGRTERPSNRKRRVRRVEPSSR
jgi:hypothetical protein